MTIHPGTNPLRAAALLTAALLTTAWTTGCHVDQHKNAAGDDNVKITTPFGGLSVKTDDAQVQSSVGLAQYPGSTLVADKGKNNGGADVNFSFGNFHVGVKALTYHTADAPDKVLAFYRKDMAHFGSVIQCHSHKPVGQPERTAEGLGCDANQGHTVNVTEDAQQELKAGSKQHQHIAAIERQDTGTKISLVALDLPGGGDDESKQ